MYQLGEVDDAYLERELTTIKAQQATAERRLTATPLELDDMRSVLGSGAADA